MTAMIPTSVLYQISENDLEKLIIKAEEKGFERGQKKTIEPPLTKEAAAKFMRLSVRQFDAKFKEGKLPAKLRRTKTGTIYFFASELSDYLKEQ
jgi:hypothetical protein